MDAQALALISVIGIGVAVAFQWRLIFSLSAIGVFCISHLVIMVAGIVALPFIWSEVLLYCPYFNLTLITDEDLQRAIILNVGGGGLILLSYQLSSLFLTQRFVWQAPNLLSTTPVPRLDLSITRLLILSIGLLGFTVFALFSNMGDIVTGIQEGILTRQNDLVMEARYALADQYVFFLTTNGPLIYCAIALWLLFRLQGDFGRGLVAVAYTLVAVFAVAALFQKRPLLLFLGGFLMAEYWRGRQLKVTPPPSNSTRRLRKVISPTGRKPTFFQRMKALSWFGVAGGVLLALLALLLFAQTNVGREGGSIFETTYRLFFIAVMNIVLGQSLPATMYAHYYPAIAPYYGFGNVGLLSKVFGYDLVKTTFLVYSYFALGNEEGSIANPALMDFYGGFGYVGWFLGAGLLGLVLRLLDFSLERLRASVSKTVLVITTFVFVHYLTVASLFNSLLGYGGISFFLCWLLLWSPSRGQPKPGATTAPVKRQPSAVA